jgi:hypothetical protein
LAAGGVPAPPGFVRRLAGFACFAACFAADFLVAFFGFGFGFGFGLGLGAGVAWNVTLRRAPRPFTARPSSATV